MNTTQIFALISVGLFAIVNLTAVFRKRTSINWVAPFALSLVFLGYSVYTISVEGLLGFWDQHIRDLWGNQIWFDLLIAIATAFLLMLGRARAQKMNLALWFFFILSSGSIGLLAMVARLIYLESHKATSGNRRA